MPTYAQQFGDLIAKEDFTAALGLLSREAQQVRSPDDLREAAIGMTGYAPGPIQNVVIALKHDSELVRDYGRTNRIERLTTDKWSATEDDGWAMTAITARLAGAESAYRLPNRDSYIFMLLKKVELVGDANQ